ncbi:hypothetical protein DLP05_142 [Stenotrophomonas phage vB_SmaS_DLP_5]|uniref:Uncharacterized protein n=1 Tax=Stenotrophomonas phage vB_SmaS_DLP_5 TaxID=2044561 RepID=A0A2D2W2B9_9CAUD|nr:hypothetical protein FDJ07_gp079 [Stenotrophomonas phage vB_SmaS_DLP_5]ATS92292.1 hypothetical protein DLP05_142 [Stenotrophomonas phage vB_SmaS_DLP_5]
MKYRSKDTVASLLAIPQARAVDMSQIDAEKVAGRIREFKKTCKEASPEGEALRFYGLNQCMAVIAKKYGQHGVLPPHLKAVAEAYVRELVDQSERLFSYMVLINTRESRHVHGGKGDFDGKFAKEFGKEALKFNETIRGSGSSTAVDRFITNPPKMKIGPYLRSLEWCFFNGSFSGGFGGKPWGNIAKTLADAVNGVTSMEIMVDTAYTLAHNNGPMFNKGMMYGHYGETIYRVLDVQRSGQVVELCRSGTVSQFIKKSDLLPLFDAVVKEFPDEFGEYVDWIKVEKLGSVKKYPNEIKEQKIKYGEQLGPEFKNMKPSGKLEVFPEVFVTLMKRQAK